ncbi:MAG: helix-turn-helix domain-containing protein [Candidatus Coproplasma sp.]
MSISKNLQYLRKREGVTQEELAEQMQVSRQAVSKWETGEACPDTDKLIALCDRFGVSMDDFARGDLTACADTKTVADAEADNAKTAENTESVSDMQIDERAVQGSKNAEQESKNAEIVRSHYKKFADLISTGVFLILVGVSVCVAMCAVAKYLGQSPTAKLITVSSGAVVVAFVAVAVLLFVPAGITHNNFIRKYGVACALPESEIERFNKKFMIVVAVCTSGIILDVAALIVAEVVCSGIYESAALQTTDSSLIIVSAFLLVVSFFVAALCHTGITKSFYDLAALRARSESSESGRTVSRREKLADAVCGVIMLAATAIFLTIGFIWNLWHPGWIVFPIGGIICSIIKKLSGVNGE